MEKVNAKNSLLLNAKVTGQRKYSTFLPSATHFSTDRNQLPTHNRQKERAALDYSTLLPLSSASLLASGRDTVVLNS